MNDLISIIVPIYNVENYLERCIQSLINQTYKNIEIILVDDGSPDNCPAICDKYANVDNRIKVIHKVNGGLSDARNAGFNIATGKYICYVDSDDVVSNIFVEHLHKLLIEKNADIVSCNVERFSDTVPIDQEIDNEQILELTAEQAVDELIVDGKIRQHVWNKLYRYDVVKNIPFVVGKLNEDEFWSYKVCAQCNKIVTTNLALYYYFQREGSIINSKYNLNRLDVLEAKYERWKYLAEKIPSTELAAKRSFYFECIYCGQMTMKFMDKKNKKEAYKKIKSYLKKISFTKEETNTFDKKTMFWYRLSRVSFKFNCFVKCIFNKGF